MNAQMTRSWLEARNQRTFDDLGARDMDALFSGIADEVIFEIPFHRDPVRLVGKSAMRGFMNKTQGILTHVGWTFHRIHVDVDACAVFSEVTASIQITGIAPVS